MSSIDEDNALLLEKLVRVSRRNSHIGLEEVYKISQTRPKRIVDQSSTYWTISQNVMLFRGGPN